VSRLELEIGGRRFAADSGRATSLAIPLDFHGAQPHAFGAPRARGAALEGRGFVGDVGRGGSCNVGTYALTPHCNGTHTECVGHLTAEPAGIDALTPEPLIPATLVTVEPEPAAGHPEADAEIAAPDDPLVSARALRAALVRFPDLVLYRAIAIRTLPNGEAKRARDWDDGAPVPYLTRAAAALLAELGCEHVLVDLPSLDRMADRGKLAAHRAFWGLAEGATHAAEARRGRCTVTELIYVPDVLADGPYLLDLQLPAFVADAAPSRPLLMPLEALA
jgi:kynurenine formamidase